MSWLLRDDEVLAAIEERHKGWRQDVQGAVLLPGPALVQTFLCHRGLDLAWCATDSNGDGPGLLVRRITCLPPNRVVRPRLLPGTLVVASAGAFERWRLRVGDRLEVRQA